MFLDLILLITSILFIVLYVKCKKELDRFKRKSFESSHTHHATSEEFSLGLKKLNSEFTENVLLDPLTKLPGREAFDDRLMQALNQSQRFKKSFAVILLDIHEFRVLNEAQGYETGDKILIEVAKRLKSVIRQIDTMTRYAGDTFVFLLPQLAMPETAAYVAQRLLDSIVQPFKIDTKNIFITASIGVSIYPSDGQDIKTLLLNANNALHQAKICGQGRYQFYKQELHALGQRELMLTAFFNSPDFLEKLFIYYQRQMNVEKNEVVCIQAIPYLELPEIGLVPFNDFARIAQNSGKLLEVGEWLLRNGILQFQKWHKEGFTPDQLAINVTLHQIENPQFIYKVTQILQELHVNPRQIVFEVTDDNLLSNTESLEKAFTMLNHIGIQISVSVFSLGSFALQRITKLPVNSLKIDSKLIQGKKLTEGNQVIVQMIIALAKDMQIKVVAEGIENVMQKDILLDLGCELMQGQLFGEPLPVEALVKHL